MLADLATSGVGRLHPLYLTLEWHRHSKLSDPAERLLAQRLDGSFNKYPNRCYDGSCNLSVGDASTLQSSLEKTLAYMLHRAGITYVDQYFDVINGRKVPVPTVWDRTRGRRDALISAGAMR